MLHRLPHMRLYPTGPGETDRCATLRDLGILDTPSDDNFDAAVKLASLSFGVPVALVALIDEHREWFKAITGWQTREAPREVAFCNYTILQDDVLVVEDATLDPRFSQNPLVTGAPHIRFYAGVPIGRRLSSDVTARALSIRMLAMICRLLATLCCIPGRDRAVRRAIPRCASAEPFSQLRPAFFQ